MMIAVIPASFTSAELLGNPGGDELVGDAELVEYLQGRRVHQRRRRLAGRGGGGHHHMRHPSWASRAATVSPVGPAPTTATSVISVCVVFSPSGLRSLTLLPRSRAAEGPAPS